MEAPYFSLRSLEIIMGPRTGPPGLILLRKGSSERRPTLEFFKGVGEKVQARRGPQEHSPTPMPGFLEAYPQLLLKLTQQLFIWVPNNGFLLILGQGEMGFGWPFTFGGF